MEVFHGYTQALRDLRFAGFPTQRHAEFINNGLDLLLPPPEIACCPVELPQTTENGTPDTMLSIG